MSGLALDQPITDPLLGKTLAERYRIVKKLGEGGMGAVYEGEHLIIKKRVAIKVLHPQFAATPEIVARFHQEALAATAIGHEHIVEVNDMGRTPEGALFMVLEYLAGRDFSDLLDKESPLPIGRITHIVSQICDAVAAAHEKGIVHRDLKPENVFLIKRGGDPDFAKVLDFGISKMKDGGNSHSQTKTGAIIGTAYYMAPEQAMGKKSIDHRADIWAIGVILFYALTRRFPFEDEAYPMLIVKICSDAAPRPSQFRSDLPPELDSLILRCLSKDPAARPQSCAELVALLGPMRALSSVLPGTRLSAPGPAPSSGVRTPVSREPLAFEATAAGVTQTPALPAQPNATPVSAETAASAGLPPRPRWQGPAAIAVVASLLAGGAVYAATQGGSTPEVIPAAVTPPAVVPEVEALAADPVPEPTPPAAVGHIDFLVSPSEAVVLLDGRPVIADPDGNVRTPTNIDDGAIHELRFEARGFRSRVEDLRVSYPQRIVVSLDPGTGVDDRRATATGSAGATRVGRHSSGTGASAPGGSGTPTGGATSGGATSGGATSGGATSGGASSPTAVAETPTTPTAPREEPASEARTLPEGVVAPPPAAALKRTRIP